MLLASSSSHSSDSEDGYSSLPIPPTNVQYTGDPAEVFQQLQSIVQDYGYALTIQRSKVRTSGLYFGEVFKLYIICDQGRKAKESTAQKRKRGATRCKECPFKLIATRIPDHTKWNLTCKDDHHNHQATPAVAHPKHRQIYMTAENREVIRIQTKVGATPSHIAAEFLLRGKRSGFFCKLILIN